MDLGKPACWTPLLVNTLRQSLTACSTPISMSPTASAMSEGEKPKPPLTAPQLGVLMPKNATSGGLTVSYWAAFCTVLLPMDAGGPEAGPVPCTTPRGIAACAFIAWNVSGSTGV